VPALQERQRERGFARARERRQRDDAPFTETAAAWRKKSSGRSRLQRDRDLFVDLIDQIVQGISCMRTGFILDDEATRQIRANDVVAARGPFPGTGRTHEGGEDRSISPSRLLTFAFDDKEAATDAKG
jgi:hypothetical protein